MFGGELFNRRYVLQILFYILVCLAATTAGGISGIGGGVIIKPVLDAVSDMPVETISFLSGCTVLAMSVSSMISGRNDTVNVEKRRGTALAIGAVLGGILGKSMFQTIAVVGCKAVVVTQQSMMMVLTLLVLVYTLNRSRIPTKNIRQLPGCCCVGLLLGILSSFLGIGGGPINLMVLYYFFSMDTKAAALNSLYIILFSQTASLANTVFTRSIPAFDLTVLLVMVASGILGGRLGRKLSRMLSSRQMDILFLILLVVITLISGYNLIRAC